MRALAMQGATVEPSVGSLASFVGGFHPVVVHLPIGIFALAVGLELLALRRRSRPAVDGVQSIVLGAAIASAVLAFVLGVALGSTGGYPTALLDRHRAFASATIVGVAASGVAWWAHRQRGASRLLPRAVMGLTLAALTATGHLGGSLSRGEGHLLASAPAAVRRLLGATEVPAPSSIDAPPSQDPLVFDDVVRPLLRDRCVSCHGPTRAKGRLRLDDLDALRRGGTSGPTLVAGHAARSLLVARLRLPPTDTKHMPPEGEEQLTEAEIELLAFWIDRGARTDLRIRDTLAPVSARPLLEERVAHAAAPSPPPASTPAVERSDAQADAEADAPATPPSPAPSPAVPPAASPAVSAAPPGGRPPPPPGWNAVRDILERRCVRCHGPREAQGGLRVDSLDALERGGDGGPAIVRGRPGAGTLLARVHLPLDDADHMPPDGEPQLTPEELRRVTAFVDGSPARGPLAPVASAPPTTPPSPGADAPAAAAPTSPGETAAAPSAAPAAAAPSPRSPVAAAPRPPPVPTGGCLSCAVGGARTGSPRLPLGAWIASVGLLALRRHRRRAAAARRL